MQQTTIQLTATNKAELIAAVIAKSTTGRRDQSVCVAGAEFCYRVQEDAVTLLWFEEDSNLISFADWKSHEAFISKHSDLIVGLAIACRKLIVRVGMNDIDIRIPEFDNFGRKWNNATWSRTNQTLSKPSMLKVSTDKY